MPALEQAREESNLRSSVLETATPPWLEPKGGEARMTLCALKVKRLTSAARSAQRLPAHDGAAGFGRIPSSRLQLAMEP